MFQAMACQWYYFYQKLTKFKNGQNYMKLCVEYNYNILRSLANFKVGLTLMFQAMACQWYYFYQKLTKFKNGQNYMKLCIEYNYTILRSLANLKSV